MHALTSPHAFLLSVLLLALLTRTLVPSGISVGIGFAGPGEARNAGTTPANTSSTTSTTTVERLATPASTSVSNAVNPVLGKGDWLEYHVRVSGKGPSGPVSFGTYVEVTDTAVALEGLINEIVEEVLGIDPREDLGGCWR